MTNVTIKIEVSDQHCADIMCTALEGGIGYWAQARKIKQHALPEDAAIGLNSYLSCELAELNDDESGYNWKKPYKLDYGVIRLGIERIVTNPKYARLGTGILRDIVSDEIGCYIDAGVADVIVQFGLFNEERYA
jgi:hypothetical protein